MNNRTDKRNLADDRTAATLDLLSQLNHYCFHTGGGDENCKGCLFENRAPCPLAVFHDELGNTMLGWK